MRDEFLPPAEAARRLGVSAKALRLYEARGLLSPLRTGAGWRAYGPAEMARAREVAALRALGLSLAQVGRLLNGDLAGLEPALAAHQAALEARMGEVSEAVGRVRALRDRLARGETPGLGELARLAPVGSAVSAAFDLPWPWGGEPFEMRLPALTYLTGPLGSGKTRLARAIAEALPGAVFLGLDRAGAGSEATLHALVADGATPSDALRAVLAGIEAEGVSAVVVDPVEDGLDAATQEALIAHLRRRGPAARPLVLMTRSTAILDLSALGPDEAILYCPANHSSPMLVQPWPGSAGYEAVATCLASPEVRARTAGTIAVRPDAA
jgi:DNA-binding transcriptional MerR regulator